MAAHQNRSPDAPYMPTMRTVAEVMADLELLSHEPGFIYTLCFMVLESLWMTTGEVAEIDWHQRPNHQELSLLLGRDGRQFPP